MLISILRYSYNKKIFQKNTQAIQHFENEFIIFKYIPKIP